MRKIKSFSYYPLFVNYGLLFNTTKTPAPAPRTTIAPNVIHNHVNDDDSSSSVSGSVGSGSVGSGSVGSGSVGSGLTGASPSIPVPVKVNSILISFSGLIFVTSTAGKSAVEPHSL